MKDYSVTVQDDAGRVAVLYINGDSVSEAVKAGAVLSHALEEHESNAFWGAVQAGKISETAYEIANDGRPV